MFEVLEHLQYMALSFQQQMQAQHLPHAHAPPIPMGPHPAGLQPPGLPVSSAGMNLFSLGPGHAQAHISSLKEDKGMGIKLITTNIIAN